MRTNVARAERTSVEKQLRRAEMNGRERALRRAMLRLQTGVGERALRKIPIIQHNLTREIAQQAEALTRDIRTQPFRRPVRQAFQKA